MGAALRSGQKPRMAQRRHLKIGGLKRVSLLRFFSRLKRNEVPPRTGANRNKQENTTYAGCCGEQKDSTLSPHSPQAKSRKQKPTTKRSSKRSGAYCPISWLASISSARTIAEWSQALPPCATHALKSTWQVAVLGNETPSACAVDSARFKSF